LNRSGDVSAKGGQILKAYAANHKIPVSTFNKHQRVVGRDYARRNRRSLKTVRVSRATFQPIRTASELKKTIAQKVRTGELEAGVPVAPRTFLRTNITETGQLEETQVTVYARKVSLKTLRKK
jgi:hypothetical protein